MGLKGKVYREGGNLKAHILPVEIHVIFYYYFRILFFFTHLPMRQCKTQHYHVNCKKYNSFFYCTFHKVCICFLILNSCIQCFVVDSVVCDCFLFSFPQVPLSVYSLYVVFLVGGGINYSVGLVLGILYLGFK